MLDSKTSKKIQIKALNVKTGEFQSKILTLESGIQGECLIGRHQSCGIILNLPEVSRVHGRLFCLDGQCYFTDLGSTCGSQINSEKVQFNCSYLLKPNDLLRIAQFVITFADMSSEEREYKPVWSSGDLTVRCIQVVEETHDVKTFCFVADPPILFSYKPGQFVTLNLSIGGKDVRRSYSLSSSPTRPYSIEITVKRVLPTVDAFSSPPGLVSNWLHDNFRVGNKVQLSSPRGKFTCANLTAPKLLFISAGSGITPLMSMSRWLYDTRANVDIVFIHCARTPIDLIFRSELELMAATHPNFKLAVTITRLEFGHAWQGYTGKLNGYTGRLHESMLMAIAPDFQERTAYVCGSDLFMKAIKTMLNRLDFPLSNYYQESFGDSQPKNEEASTQSNHDEKRNLGGGGGGGGSKTTTESPVVVFAKSGREISCDEDDCILDVAELEGIELPSGCRMGVCGACKLPLSGGKVDYDDEPECERGYLLTCIAKARGRVVVEA